MDTTESPKQNFYKFVNGNWLKKTKIPDDRSSWGVGYEVYMKTKADVASILKDAEQSGKYAEGTDQRKAIDLYESILDTVSRNKNGDKPLQPYFKKIDAIKNASDLENYLIEMEPIISSGFFGTGVDADLKNSSRNVVYLGTGALGLPNREYYVSKDKNSEEIRKKYVNHIAKMLQLVGETKEKATVDASEVLNFETKLAIPRLTKVERRNPNNIYNLMTVSQLNKIVPVINWKRYFNSLGAKNLDTVIVSQPKYMVAVQHILTNTPVNDWKNYLKWIVIRTKAGTLSTTLEKTNWNFYSHTLRGTKKQVPIQERALSAVNSGIGESLGKLYVDKMFPPEAKAKAKSMIENIIAAYKIRINKLPWMTKETKVKAINKLDKLRIKIGYPDKWKDYSTLKIASTKNGGSYFQNLLDIGKWNYKKDIAKIGKPVDRTEWHMSPQTVNAYYNPLNNEIVFPAAILQPPFYNYKADAAVNYGGIGAVIGHEISHAFDDSGSRFDANGNLKNWWQKEDLQHFKELGKKLINQFSALEPIKGVHVNGAYTIGENIGDLGGTNAAYDGLEMYLKKNGRPKKIDGFTPEQRFFISWATVWRTKSREAALKNQIKTDPHAPGMYRAYIPLTNEDAFYKAFNIQKGDSMYVKPADRVKIW